ncbi:zinc finger and BTB domain-containing protein 7C [Erpetoichthys calabaricus]|uniref:zinc finger and BTB domain-containing protein 7C n=1 Tax=Erpetoichthys calabaricus TaxID=27687 RepID=UPI0022344025|nr:zinc finger and BTB domain-containing protein 7C [Erpetoichthys calabaricus]XP_051785755.1 zinc finger and BTB domain-containing protein 7C [Erpetoichthys calabaricus]
MASSDDDLIGIPFPNHSSDVLCSLNEQRQNGLLCDVLLIVKEHEYYTHRSVLAACSKYFQKLFTVGSSGEQHNVYEIDFVTPESLGAILEFTYTSTLTITASNVKEILNAAQMLEIPCVINVCLEIMETHREADEEEDEEEDDEEEDEEEEENASEILEPQESEKSAIAQNSCPSTSNPERTPEEDFCRDKSRDFKIVEQFTDKPKEQGATCLDGGTYGPLRDFSIESLLQEGLYPKINLPDSRPNFSPLMPSFFPPMWAGDFAAFPQILDHRHQEMESGPLDLVIKKEKIKEELKDELQPNGFPSEFFKDLIGLSSRTQLGPIKEESDFSTYLNFLSATHLTGLFPPWQLEEERKMKPKASQQCPICNKVIQGAGKLPRHMRTHTGEKPYMCNICEVRFTRQDKLKIHMRKHTGERPYICIHCNSKFVHNYDLKNHLRIHTGVRPYQCEHCYKSFTRSDHLHRHIKRQSCRVSRPRRGRKPTAWRSTSLLYSQSNHHNAQEEMGARHLPPSLGMAISDPNEKCFLESHLHPRNALSLSMDNLDSRLQATEVKLPERNHILEAEKNQGIFAFALTHENSLPHRPFFSSANDTWGMRLGHATPIPEATN